jgi:nitrous oxidase accessory protein NosD
VYKGEEDMADVTVNCDAGDSISAVLDRVGPGDRIVVSGTCRESVFIKPHMTLITLLGQGTATIAGPPPAESSGARPDTFAIFSMGQRIRIEGFTITGGFNGIHLSGPATAEIANNVIRGSEAGAIHIDKGAIALIYGNIIESNKLCGINVIENSYARIGFPFPTQSHFEPNLIRNNEGDGIVVRRRSSVWVMGNEITNNTGAGVLVDGGSQADVVANDISGNGRDGITVSRMSGVSFHSTGNERPESGNKSSAPNIGFGVRCDIGGYVEGELGSLSGSEGAHADDGSAIVRLR